MTEWAIFHMSTSQVSCYSCTTKNSSDHLISQRTNTKPRDKQWPQNSHYSFLRNNMLTLKPCVQIGQWGSEVSTATTSCCKKNYFLLRWSANGNFLSVGCRSITSERTHISITCERNPHCSRQCLKNREQGCLQRRPEKEKEKKKPFAGSVANKKTPVIWYSMT